MAKVNAAKPHLLILIRFKIFFFPVFDRFTVDDFAERSGKNISRQGNLSVT
jgi:hypothetical protein